MQRTQHPELFAFEPLTLDPDKAVEEVELSARVGTWTPVSSSYFIGLLCEAWVLSYFVQNMRGQGAVLIGLENHTCREKEDSHQTPCFPSSRCMFCWRHCGLFLGGTRWCWLQGRPLTGEHGDVVLVRLVQRVVDDAVLVGKPFEDVHADLRSQTSKQTRWNRCTKGPATTTRASQKKGIKHLICLQLTTPPEEGSNAENKVHTLRCGTTNETWTKILLQSLKHIRLDHFAFGGKNHEADDEIIRCCHLPAPLTTNY